jgi:hypothetical protein
VMLRSVDQYDRVGGNFAREGLGTSAPRRSS